MSGRKSISNTFSVSTVEDGVDAVYAYASTDKIVVECNSDGTVKTAVNKTITLTMKVGDATFSFFTQINIGTLPSGVSVQRNGSDTVLVSVGATATSAGIAAGFDMTLHAYNGIDEFEAPIHIALIGSIQGQNVIRVDLDNEYDSIQYQGDGVTKVNPSATVQATAYLFDGAEDKSSNATFTISNRSGMSNQQATISGRVVTVSGLTSDGEVTIRAEYPSNSGKYYYTNFVVKKLIGTDKYDLVVTPNAVPVNTSNTVADTTLSVQVYRTPANGGTRHLVQFTNKTTNDYGLTLSVKDSLDNNLTETTGTGTVTTRTFNLTGTMATNADNVTIVLTKDSKTQDSETIPITHVHNGIDGSGSNAVKIDLDNEMDSIPCDSNGKVMSQTVLEVNARIYDGASPVSSGVAVSSVGAIAGVSAVTSISSGVVNIKWTIPATGSGTPLSVDKYTSQVVLTWGGNSYYATFTANVVKSGQPGITPTIYQLLPSPSQISFKRDSSGVIPSSTQTLTLSIKKTNESGQSVITVTASGLTVRYRTDQAPSSSSDGTAWPAAGLSISSSVTYNNVYIAAFGSNGTLVDREVVAIVKDGENGVDGTDASEVNPNILLRTIFDRGIDFVKEQWSSDWTVTSIDAATDTIVEGRKSIRINMSNSQGDFCDFYQLVYGKLKASTWYTVSFNYFSTQAWNTFLHSNVGSYPAYYDASAGIIIDGVMQTMSGNNGTWQWPADWTGQRHTMTFKTASDLSGIWDNSQLLFRVPQGCQLALCMPKLEIGQVATAYMANEDDLRGEKGDDGARGKIGRFFYFAGTFNSQDNDPTHGFVVNDAQAPYFEHIVDGKKRYHVFNYDTNGTYTMSQMWAISSNWNNKPWEAMTDDFKYLITEAIFASFAKLGSFVISSDWMLSTNGTINGTAYNNGASYNGAAAYTWFDPAYPNTSVNTTHTVNGTTWTGYNFVPNYCVDGRTGTAFQTSGVFSGFIKKKKIVITTDNISEYTKDYSDGSFTYKYILLEKCGTFIEIGNGVNYNVMMPFFSKRITGMTEEEKDEIRSYIGTKVIIYNKTGTILGVFLNNSVTASDTKLMNNNTCCCFECVLWREYVSDGYYEVVKWVVVEDSDGKIV